LPALLPASDKLSVGLRAMLVEIVLGLPVNMLIDLLQLGQRLRHHSRDAIKGKLKCMLDSEALRESLKQK